MSLTKITERVITPNTIDANTLSENISVGGVGQKLTIDQIIITDENFANTENTEIPATGGFLKLYGNNYTTNSNVYLSTTFSPNTQITANVVSNNEIRLTISTTEVNTYNLFVFNEKGKFAFKQNALTSVNPTYTLTVPTSINEGASGTCNVTTTNVSDGTTLYWTVSPAGDFSVSSGSFTINDNFGSFIISPIADLTTEGAETATINIRTESISGNIVATNSSTINDTSITPLKTAAWFGGGYSPNTSRVDRIIFATDTATSVSRGPLSGSKRDLGGIGNFNYGWFFGGSGYLPNSIVDRITFVSDTNTASVRGPLSLGRLTADATGNQNFGWVGGGEVSGPSPKTSRVDRIDFNNDGNTASVRGPLSLQRNQISATGNDEFGWFGGGDVPPQTSRIDRITFSSDTNTASIRGPLTSIRSVLAATGNQNFGWFGGGNPLTSRVDRVTFSSDTGVATVRGSLSLNRFFLTADGNNDFGWFSGGSPTGFDSRSTIDRITFASDTGTASVRGPLGLGRMRLAAAAGIA
jgi:hypothetical protein